MMIKTTTHNKDCTIMNSRTKEHYFICISPCSRGFDRVGTLYPPFVPVNNQATKATILMDIALMYHELSEVMFK